MSGPSKITDILMTELIYDLFGNKFELKYAFVGSTGTTHGSGMCCSWSLETQKKFTEFLDSAKRDARKMHGFPEEEVQGGEEHGSGSLQSPRPHQF